MSKIIAFTSILVALATSVAAEEYHVTGHNLVTGERICGVMEDENRNGTVSAQIWDRLATLRTFGQWSGMGVAILVREDPPVAYRVEVVE